MRATRMRGEKGCLEETGGMIKSMQLQYIYYIIKMLNCHKKGK